MAQPSKSESVTRVERYIKTLQQGKPLDDELSPNQFAALVSDALAFHASRQSIEKAVVRPIDVKAAIVARGKGEIDIKAIQRRRLGQLWSPEVSFNLRASLINNEATPGRLVVANLKRNVPGQILFLKPLQEIEGQGLLTTVQDYLSNVASHSNTKVGYVGLSITPKDRFRLRLRGHRLKTKD